MELKHVWKIFNQNWVQFPGACVKETENSIFIPRQLTVRWFIEGIAVNPEITE